MFTILCYSKSRYYACTRAYVHEVNLFCFVLFPLQLSVCLWWHDYRRDDFPTLKFGVVMADLLALSEGRSQCQVPSAASCAPIRGLNPGVGTQVGMHVRAPMLGQVRAQ